MRDSDTKIIARLDALITKGDALAKTAELNKGVNPARYQVDGGLYSNWWTQAVHALTSLLGEANHYTEAFRTQIAPYAWLHELQPGMGILKAVREDAADGHLFATTVGLVSSEIFGDLLEMADHLLQEKYAQPAAVLVGAVLEDRLRRLATNKQLAVAKPSINTLNTELMRANVYSKLEWRLIQVWGEVRNAAAHGHFDDVTEEQVRDMHRGVSRFLAEYL